MAQQQSAIIYLSSICPFAIKEQSKGMASFILSVLGTGFPRQRLESAQAPCLTILLYLILL